MAGLMTHLLIVIIIGISILIFSKKWYYSVAFCIGHLIPDLIDFGITGIKIGSLNPSVIMNDSWFSPLAAFSHNAFVWIIFALIIWLIAVLLYIFKKIKKNNLANIILTLVFFIAGVIIHLVVDKVIIETSYWI